jgi:hypothetical protein
VNELAGYPADPQGEYAFRVEPFAPVITFVRVGRQGGRERCYVVPPQQRGRWQQQRGWWEAACRAGKSKRKRGWPLCTVAPAASAWPPSPRASLRQVETGGGDTAAMAQRFLERAVRAANDDIWGSLSCTLLASPATQAAAGPAVQRALDELRYGTVVLNGWSAVGFLPAAVRSCWPCRCVALGGTGAGGVLLLQQAMCEPTAADAPPASCAEPLGSVWRGPNHPRRRLGPRSHPQLL